VKEEGHEFHSFFANLINAEDKIVPGFLIIPKFINGITKNASSLGEVTLPKGFKLTEATDSARGKKVSIDVNQLTLNNQSLLTKKSDLKSKLTQYSWVFYY
jgi:hypothetical protein